MDPRVVRVWDPEVTDWSPGADSYVDHIDGDRLSAMLERGLTELTSQADSQDAWRALLGRDPVDDLIAIKVNLNAVDDDEEQRLNNSIEMICAVLAGLTAAGARQDHITVLDCSRPFVDRIRLGCEDQFPSVAYLGRDRVGLSSTESIVIPSMVVPEDGAALSVPLPQAVADADHLINLHLLKGHHGGTTGALKNLFGLARNVWTTFHGSQHDWVRWEVGRQCGELWMNSAIADKSRLLICEGVFGTHASADTVPDRYLAEDLFPLGAPSSVIVSRDPVAHDSVLYDLTYWERELAGLDNRYPDDWLVAAAQDGAGLHEHGRLVPGTFTARDLEYCNIDYRALRL